MFLTDEEIARLTQVGPGTDGGNLLRSYWHPIAGLHAVSEENPTQFVRLLGEDLVLFRDKSGRVGLLADHCAHRGASLCYGRVEERGISCAYHGWLYDVNGDCLETPAEPADSLFRLTVKQRAYPVEKLFGLYWAYLGPLPAPPIRRLDIMRYPVEHIMEMDFDANWVQVLENNLDGSHIYVLHQDQMGKKKPMTSTTRGLIDQLVGLDYRESPFGIMRRMETADGYVEEDPLIFPNMLRRMQELSIKIPVDDTHTKKFVIIVDQHETPGASNDEPVDYYMFPQEQGKSAAGVAYPEATYKMTSLRYQDIMAIETQGRVTNRANWHPGTRDGGVAMYDRMILREMDRVKEGHNPLGVIRDPDHIVDTNFEVLHVIGGSTRGPQGVLVYERKRTATPA
jgi:5,5'-dehydrodivanillate O-demethylase oxygenase subunit